ncbi:phage antirepressor KilAC domain-containing protein [Streptococcus agalactiae]|uniref:Phage repressor protein/antirepressor Ant n=1 Tax=Streptococcus agalactiae TaxID=1311 RepID=A0A7Z6WID3_STRAG|nr:phage antirepressor KilAC domain-containing protein [Streptococcus agalactiae]MCC9719478.1 phage repressor protein/antirepressor Ant [Streptococcus agalactiae]MCW1792495.1 phage antirepressor KilAC domain-containing protein [Streptococcus agalactiae]MCW1813407.1 phage antirepressor KilAC domain-containing protein [Streptococcus agalactiae]RDY91485.1 phage repressor protein/antirepressor Ant [Streptococcus agalactiae]HEN0425030.1 phage antirepressor KilAC domain-containing protein [Streptoco
MQEIFNFKGQEVRTVTIDNEPYFVGKDVAEILGYTNSKDALKNHVDSDDKQILQRSQNATLEIPNRGLTIINESGVYNLIFAAAKQSANPEIKEKAQKFKRWVTSEVLPTIRKHGMYATDELLDNPDFAIATLQKLKEEREAKKLLEAQIEADRPKVLFADAVSASKSSCLIGELAKILKQNGIDIGQNKLFQWLRANGYLISRRGESWNQPTQKSMQLGLFELKKTAINHSDGHTTTNVTPKVTGKGQQYFINKFLNQEYLPV